MLSSKYYAYASLILVFLTSIKSIALEPYDAYYAENTLTVPIISAQGEDYQISLVLDTASDLSEISCAGYCFKLTAGIQSVVKAPPNYPNYQDAIASIQRLWVEETLYKVELEHKGELNGHTYFQLNSAKLHESIFAETPVVLKNPEEYYQQACSKTATADANPMIYSAIPVELNNDTHVDFIVAYQCMLKHELRGTEVTTETPSVLVAFVSDELGNYQVNNEAVFGERYPSYGGAVRKHVRGDINGDGIDDFAFAMNYEDGRAGGTNELNLTQTTQPTVILSNGLGKYKIERLGLSAWGHAVDLAHNSQGGIDFIFAGFVGEHIQAFRYVNGEFVNVIGEYPDVPHKPFWATSFRATPRTDSAGATSVFVNQYADSEGEGLAIWKKEDSAWKRTSTYTLPISFYANYITWQGTQQPTPVLNINGKQYLSGNFSEICIMENFDNTDDYIIAAKFGTSFVSTPINTKDIYYSDDTFAAQLFLFFREVDGTLEPIASPIANEFSTVNSNFYDCADVNGDGKSDLVNYAFSVDRDWGGISIGGQPLVYLNNGKGNLVKIGTENYPKFLSWQSQGDLHDVNKDGLADLLLYQMYVEDDGSSNDIHIYLAKDNIGN